jgi:flagellar biosynthesis protein FlhA
MVRSHAAELLTRQQVQGLLDELHARVPQLVDELIPGVLKSSQVQQVLCNLLRERVPVRDLEAILEVLGHSAHRTQNPILLTEYVRAALARTISQQCRGSDRVLHAVTLSDDTEGALADGFRLDGDELHVHTTQSLRASVISGLRDRVKRLSLAGRPEVIVCRPEVRAGLRQITAQEFPRLHVLSRNEVTADTELVLHGTVELPVDLPEPVEFRHRAAAPIVAAMHGSAFRRRAAATLATTGGGR